MSTQTAIDWLFSLVRIVGAGFPATSMLVQFQAEIDSKILAERVRRLEDPISAIHPDVPDLARHIYRAIEEHESAHVDLDEELYEKYARPLAALEALGIVEGQHTLSKRYFAGLRIRDHSFVMYMCALCEDDSKMQRLVDRVDSCKRREWLNGEALSEELGLPVPVVAACFRLFEAKGYGLCSNTRGETRYMSKV